MNNIQRPAFETTKTEEERAEEKGRKISLRLNEVEVDELEKDMILLDIGVDSAAIKLLVDIGRNVLRHNFGAENLAYLVSLKRTRYDGRKR